MMSLYFAFFLFVATFAVIGFMRGWAKELIVLFSIVLGLVLIMLLRKYVPVIQAYPENGIEWFWIRTGILGGLVFFGYQTVNFSKMQGKVIKQTLTDSLLGLVAGTANGYLLIASIWTYVSQAGYPYPDFVSAPAAGTAMGDAALALIKYFPANQWLFNEPYIYFIQVGAFLVMLAVFI